MVGVLAGLLQHALDGPALVEPGLDLGIKDGHRAGTLVGCGVFVHRLAQHAGDGITMVADELRNFGLAPAFLVEVVHR